MKYLSAICLSALIGLSATQSAQAQGCSDAGFCTIGAMRPGPALQYDADNIVEEMNSVALSVTVGSGENDVNYISPQIEYRHFVFPKGYIEAKLPFNTISGDLANTMGIGDLMITYTHELTSEYSENWTVLATGGGRISLGNANLTDDMFRPLPMAYQPNLGTTDLILGVSAGFKKYASLSVGYQQPVYQYNENGYDRLWQETGGEYIDYFVSRKLYRRGDVMARLQGGYNGYRAGIMVGPLAIYHLGDDIYTTVSGREWSLPGSEGLTLNIAGNVYYRIPAYERKGYWQIDVSGGAPVIQRDYRPDGLTRNWVVIPRFTYFF